MEAIPLYKKQFQVDYGDSDYYKKLKLSSMFNYFQDISILHSDNIGVGIGQIQKDFNVTWVMIRIMLKIDRFPNWGEAVTVETWPIKPKRLEFERDYMIKDQQGNVLVRAISSWVIMDVDQREIRRSDLLNSNIPYYPDKRALDNRLGKLKPNGNLEFVYTKKIGYSDIDMNGHLNNSKYIDYITDCFSIETHEKYAIDTVQVNYIGEALAGDTISFYRDISLLEQKQIYVEGVDEINEKAYFKACITIK